MNAHHAPLIRYGLGVGGIMLSPSDEIPKNFATPWIARTPRSIGRCQRGESLSRGAALSGTETERSRRSARVEAIEERKRMAVALLNPGSVSRASGVVVD